MSVYGELAYFYDAVMMFPYTDIVACSLVAYRTDQELASYANPVVFRRCVVELGREEQNYLRERSRLTCRLNTAT